MSKDYKLNAAEEWLEKSKDNKCIGFIAFAINENDDCCYAANCEAKQLVIMLANGCDSNPLFKTILLSLAKHYEEQERTKEIHRQRCGGQHGQGVGRNTC